VHPTKFAQKRDNYVAYMGRNCFGFGSNEGFKIKEGDQALMVGYAYEAPDQGVALFIGDGGCVFRAARWELWEVE
jgi:hypothetical protein